MNNTMVAHLWAHQSCDNAHGSHFYFRGPRIYSYGTHYEVGRVVYNKKATRAYLINISGYSNSTAKHINYALSAIPDSSLVFKMNGIKEYSIKYITEELDIIITDLQKYKTARTNKNEGEIWNRYQNIKKYIEFYKMKPIPSLLKLKSSEWGLNDTICNQKNIVEKVREYKKVLKCLYSHPGLEQIQSINVIVDEICGAGTWDNYKERCIRYKNSLTLREEIRYKNSLKSLEEKIELWKKGAIRDLPMSFYQTCQDKPNVFLRIKNNMIETSKGISITIEEAKRLWTIIKAFHNGHIFQHNIVNDAKNNKWAFNKYENDILTAGCHRIGYEEMESIAIQLNF